MYDQGQGLKTDYDEAARWYRRAAEQGNADVQYVLGSLYSIGRGVARRDYTQAARWWRKAAEQGLAAAQFALGFLYYLGEGVPQDYAEAHMWVNLAASRATGEDQKKCATARDAVAALMTAEPIAEAQCRAREWKQKSGENQGERPMK